MRRCMRATILRRDPLPLGLRIDEANAYSPAAASRVNEAIEAELEHKKEPVVPVTGIPQVTVEKSLDQTTGLITVKESDPIVKCAPSTAFPPTAASCKSFVSTGIEPNAKWKTGDANQVASMTDNWRSTDGAAHTLNALYDQDDASGGEGGAYEFPGHDVFAPTKKGQTVALPPGLGRIYYKEDAETPASGDGELRRGRSSTTPAPRADLGVPRHQQQRRRKRLRDALPGHHPRGRRLHAADGFRPGLQALRSRSAVSGSARGLPASEPPALSITSPANGTTVSSPSVTVSGAVTDKRVITSFTVDGKTVSVGTNGAWSTSVTLNKGANTITALATDQAGFSTEKSASVTYTPPSPPVAHASQVGATKGKNGEVTFTLTCKGTAGTSCEIEATLTTIEKLRHGRLVAVSARRHPPTRSEQVTVGSSTLTIPAGQKVTISIPLNSTGKGLLSKFGALPVHLSVVQLSPGTAQR